MPQQIATPLQSADGFVWAMGEQGDLFRFNPYARAGEHLDVHDRFWAEAQPHAFSLARLRGPFGAATEARGQLAEEACAVVATAERVLISGLFSKQRRSFTPTANEQFLVNSRDEYQFASAQGSSLFLLSRYAEQISFCVLSLEGGPVRRFAVARADTAVCGPVVIQEGASEHAVFWSSRALWIYTGDDLQPMALPEAVELCTRPTDTGLRLPQGQSPALAVGGRLFLAARHFGRPALLRLARGAQGWSTSVIAMSDEGTLSVSTSGDPLLATAGRLLACIDSSFRTLVQDSQIAARFPAWEHTGLSLYFCEAVYGVLKQWLKAYSGETEVPLCWNLPSGVTLHACHGFQSTGTALTCLCVLEDRGLRTEFLSWCV